MSTVSSGRFAEAMQTFSEAFDRAAAERATALTSVTEEVARVQEALASLQQQLAALQEAREEAKLAVATAKPKAALGRARLRELLLADRDQLAARAAEMKELEEAREARIQLIMSEGEPARIQAEVAKFESETMKLLDAIPESMRPMLLAGYDNLRKQLEEHREKASAEPVQLEGEEFVLELAYAIDAPEGSAELFTALLPVMPPVRVRDSEPPADLNALLAYQVSVAVRAGFAELGVQGVECFFGEYEGLVAVEAEVPESHEVEVPKVHAALQKSFEAAFAHEQLVAAKLAVRTYNAGVDYLLPPEDDAMAETEEVTVSR